MSQSNRDEKITTYVTEHQKQRLKDVCNAHGLSQAEVVRNALVKQIRRLEDERPPKQPDNPQQ